MGAYNTSRRILYSYLYCTLPAVLSRSIQGVVVCRFTSCYYPVTLNSSDPALEGILEPLGTLYCIVHPCRRDHVGSWRNVSHAFPCPGCAPRKGLAGEGCIEGGLWRVRSHGDNFYTILFMLYSYCTRSDRVVRVGNQSYTVIRPPYPPTHSKTSINKLHLLKYDPGSYTSPLYNVFVPNVQYHHVSCLFSVCVLSRFLLWEDRLTEWGVDMNDWGRIRQQQWENQ